MHPGAGVVGTTGVTLRSEGGKAKFFFLVTARTEVDDALRAGTKVSQVRKRDENLLTKYVHSHWLVDRCVHCTCVTVRTCVPKNPAARGFLGHDLSRR